MSARWPDVSVESTDALVDAKGDLLVGTAADTLTRIGVGTDGQVLTADSAQAKGVKWATPSGGGGGDGVARESGTNVLVGTTAGDALTSGSGNFAAGINALGAATTINSSIAIGNSALSSNVNGASLNIAIGEQTLATTNDAAAVANTAIGSEALRYLTGGNHNVAVGHQAAREVTTGAKNNAHGVQALWMNQDGHENIAIGFSAMRGYVHPDRNVAIGNRAMAGYGTALNPAGGDDGGSDNVAVGDSALGNLTDGVGNTIIGSAAGSALRSPDYVIALGYGAFNTITGGTDLIGIGQGTTAASNTLTDAIAIGRSASVGGNDSIALGRGAQTDGANVAVIGGTATGQRMSLALGSRGDATTALGGGVGVFSLQRAVTAPTSNPTQAVIEYVDPADDYMCWRTKNGTVYALAA